MSKIAQYSANLLQIMPLVSRNEKNIQKIDAPSFWINDIEQADGSHQIKVETASQSNWLGFNQKEGDCCTLFPIDGNDGVFRKKGTNVSKPQDFVKSNGKPAGDCDTLLVNDKFLFCEFKTNAISESILQIADNRTDAIAQLGKTLTYFQEKNILLDKTNCSCMIVTPPFFPKITQFPIVQNIKFLSRFGVRLEEKTIEETKKL